MPEENSFDALAKRAASFLQGKRAIALATCVGDDVHVRTVSFASRGFEICFLTFAHNLKCRQIRENANVALCRDNVQVEGTAEILGRADDAVSNVYADLLRQKYSETFDEDAAS